MTVPTMTVPTTIIKIVAIAAAVADTVISGSNNTG